MKYRAKAQPKRIPDTSAPVSPGDKYLVAKGEKDDDRDGVKDEDGVCVEDKDKVADMTTAEMGMLGSRLKAEIIAAVVP